MCFGRPATSARDACAASASRERARRLRDVALAAAALLVEQARDALVGVGLEVAERQVLELPFQLPDAEPVGERRVDVARRAAPARGAVLPAAARRGACAPVAAPAGSAPRAGRGRSPAAAGAALRCCRTLPRSACSAHTCAAARWPSSNDADGGKLAHEPGRQPLPQARHDMQDRGARARRPRTRASTAPTASRRSRRTDRAAPRRQSSRPSNAWRKAGAIGAQKDIASRALRDSEIRARTTTRSVVGEGNVYTSRAPTRGTDQMPSTRKLAFIVLLACMLLACMVSVADLHQTAQPAIQTQMTPEEFKAGGPGQAQRRGSWAAERVARAHADHRNGEGRQPTRSRRSSMKPRLLRISVWQEPSPPISAAALPRFRKGQDLSLWTTAEDLQRSTTPNPRRSAHCDPWRRGIKPAMIGNSLYMAVGKYDTSRAGQAHQVKRSMGGGSRLQVAERSDHKRSHFFILSLGKSSPSANCVG